MAIMNKVKMVCGECGFEGVKRDAWASWSIPDQKWELSFVSDSDGQCDQCGYDITIEEVPV